MKDVFNKKDYDDVIKSYTTKLNTDSLSSLITGLTELLLIMLLNTLIITGEQ